MIEVMQVQSSGNMALDCTCFAVNLMIHNVISKLYLFFMFYLEWNIKVVGFFCCM